MKPYKVCLSDPGGADVVDRDSGTRVGYVLADFYGNWECFVTPDPAGPGRFIGGLCRLRSNAAAAVWTAHVLDQTLAQP